MKALSLFLLTLSTPCLKAQDNKMILGIAYDKVIAYEYSAGEDGCVSLIDAQGKPTKQVCGYCRNMLLLL